ncbi:hypothetical protein BGZ49_004428 [Haplosporangium sp. Z 27]|nr:hypothetical protein BGZ49_004428 [Haplosporangium sp. Z 27]
MPWASDPSVKIDRFDGRALLDFLPVTTSTMVDSGLRVDRDEDGIGNELRFQRWHDLVDKFRLQISEEQCLVENEEEWNDLVAKHQALIGKVSEKKQDTNETTGPSFAFDYGTGTTQERDLGRPTEQDLTALEEENILEHLDDLTTHERDNLDALGRTFFIQDYYRLLRLAKQEHDARVLQLKVNAVNLERTLAGKKPLKSSEIDAMLSSTAKSTTGSKQHQTRRQGRRKRSSSPTYRISNRSSPSYEPYRESSSRSGSEPPDENVEYIVEFQGDPVNNSIETWTAQEPLHLSSDIGPSTGTNAWHKSSAGHGRISHSMVSDRGVGTANSKVIPSPVRMSLAEKLKQRMRQGLDSSIRSNEIKKQVKERKHELAQARENGDVVSITEQDQFNASLENSPITSNSKGQVTSSSNENPSSRDLSYRRSRNRNHSRSYSRDRDRYRSISHDRNHSRNRERSRSRGRGRDRDRDRKRSRSRSNSRRRNRSRSPRRRAVDSYSAKVPRDRSKDRSKHDSRKRSRSMSRERSRSHSPKLKTHARARSRRS